MKTIYLVKKNPDLSSEDNWITMSFPEFQLFLKTVEGARRRKHFSIIDSADATDYRIVIETDVNKARQLKAEHEAKLYQARCQRESGYSVLSYHAMGENDDDLTGEELLFDNGCDVEEQAIKSIEVQRLRDAISQLTNNEQMIIHTLFFSSNGASDSQCTKKLGIPRSTLWDQKKSILAKLKKILEKR